VATFLMCFVYAGRLENSSKGGEASFFFFSLSLDVVGGETCLLSSSHFIYGGAGGTQCGYGRYFSLGWQVNECSQSANLLCLCW